MSKNIQEIQVTRFFVVTLAIVAITLGACTGGDEGPQDRDAGGTPAADDGAASPGGGGAATVAPVGGGGGNSEVGRATVTLEGGDDEGTYEVAPIVDCNTSSTGAGFAGGDSAATAGPTTLYVLTHSEASELTDEGFAVQVVFAPVLSGNSYQVGTYDASNPDSFEGFGTLRTEIAGDTLQVNFEGTTADGVNITLEGACGPVVRR